MLCERLPAKTKDNGVKNIRHWIQLYDGKIIILVSREYRQKILCRTAVRLFSSEATL